jgi:hypothetical protein
LGRRTCLSTPCRRHDCEGTSSSLATGPPPLRHVFCNCGLADIDPELEQLAVNPWRYPQGVGTAHLENELANFRGNLWSAHAVCRFPAPICSEASAMPTDYCLRLQDRQRVQYFGGQAIKPDKHKAIDPAKRHPLRRSAASTLSWWRRRISACKAIRDRNSPAIAHQIKPQRSSIGPTINQFAC